MLANASPALAARQLTATEGTVRPGFRLKKVGNLTTLEREHPGARTSHYPTKLAPEVAYSNDFFRSQ